jgi:carbon storage regulator
MPKKLKGKRGELMLVLSRKIGESIMIDEHIQVKVIAVEGDTIKLGIEAPKDVTIHRQEVFQAIKEENRTALQLDFDVDQIKNFKNPSK